MIPIQSHSPGLGSFPVTDLSSKAASKGRGQMGDQSHLSTMQQRILNALAKHIPGMTAQGIKKLEPNEYTPEKVSDRISHFVGKGLANARAQGRSESELQSLYNSAREGMEQGLSQAREQLKAIGILNGRIAEQVDETAQLTRDKLAKLDPSRQALSHQSLAAFSMNERYHSAQQFELELLTQEGDKVTIQFDHSQAYHFDAGGFASSNGNQLAAYSLSRSEETNFRFTIQGDINDKEMAAIRDLVHDIAQLANDFYRGDVQKAFEQSQHLSFDHTQIAQFQLNMNHTEHYSIATAAYTKVQNQLPTETAKPELRLGHLMQEMREQFNRDVLAFLQQPQQAAGKLLHNLIEQDSRFKEADADQRSLFGRNLQRLLSMVNG